MDGPGPLVGGYVVGEAPEDGAVEERVLERRAVKTSPETARRYRIAERARRGSFFRHQIAVDDDGREQRLGDDVGAGSQAARRLQLRLKATACRSRNGQRRRGPDDGVDILPGQRGMDRSGVRRGL